MNARTNFITRQWWPRFLRPRRRPCRELALGIWLGCVAGSLWAEPAPPEVMNAASNGLPAFLASVSLGNKELYGFTNDAELAAARLGTPLRVFTITPRNLASHPAESKVAPLLSETSLWYFPVQVGDDTRAVLVVDHMEDGWRAVAIGYAPLARELHLIRKQWSASAGYHPRLVAAFAANRLYFTVPEVDDHNLSPVIMPGQAAEPGGAAATKAPRYSTLSPLSQSAAQLQAAFERLPARPVN
jgi:hypothetical protein